MGLKTSLSVALISAAVRTFPRTRKDLRRDGEMFGRGSGTNNSARPLEDLSPGHVLSRGQRNNRAEALKTRACS